MINRNEVTLFGIISILSVPISKNGFRVEPLFFRMQRNGVTEGLDYYIKLNKDMLDDLTKYLENKKDLSKEEIEGGNYLKKQFEEKYNYYIQLQVPGFLLLHKQPNQF